MVPTRLANVESVLWRAALRRPMDLRKVRREAEAFVRGVSAEFYLNWSGQKAEMDTSSIYKAHEGLFSKALLDGLHARRKEATGDDARRLRLLHSALMEEA